MAALLRALLGADNTSRNAAEAAFRDAQVADPNSALISLVGCMQDPSVCTDDTLRTTATTLLRRAVIGVSTITEKSTWESATPETRSAVKTALFQVLDPEQNPKVRKLLVAAIAAVADAAAESEPWPELMSCITTLAQSSSAAHKDAALRLFAGLLGTEVADKVMDLNEDIGALLLAGLNAPELQPASLVLVSEMVQHVEGPKLKPLQAALPLTEGAFKSLSASDPAALKEALEQFVAIADNWSFFKPRAKEWVEMMFTLANAQQSVDAGTRALAFEFVTSLMEAKPKLLLKAVPALPQAGLETAFSFLCEVKEQEGWEDIDSDEEEDDVDDEGLHKAGEAKVDLLVDKLGFAQTRTPLAALIEQHRSSDRWQARFAAAASVRAAVEYVDDAAMLDGMATFLLVLCKDQHIRVRHEALLALGQICHDQASDFHERWHQQIITLLLSACADPVDRNVIMAISALEAIVSDLSDTTVAVHVASILDVVFGKLQSSSNVGVLSTSVELIGQLAVSLEGGFSPYYDKLMPMLLGFAGRADAAVGSKLRGKVFESISLLGYSVGKEKFGPVCVQAMQLMLSAPLGTDDVQKEYIKDSMERIAKVMGPDFAQFLPSMLPGIFAAIAPETAVAAPNAGEEKSKNDVDIETEKGTFRIKTGQVEEIQGVIGLLTTLVSETGVAFFDYIRPSRDAIGKILNSSEHVRSLASELRESLCPCWAELVQVARLAIPTRGDEARNLVVELVQAFVDKVGADLAKADDAEDIAPLAQGIADVVTNAGQGCLQPEQIKIIGDMAVREIQKSFAREKVFKDEFKEQFKKEKVDAGDDDDEEDAIADEEDDEEATCRVGLVSIIGACVRVNPELFVTSYWPSVLPLVQEWLKPEGGHHLLALHLAVDMFDHLKEAAVPVWPIFMEAVLEHTCAQNPDERQAASYAVNLAADVPAFGAEYSARAYVSLATSLQKFKPKKTDEDGQRAQDNVVCALANLCLLYPATCPDLDGCWSAILGALPVKSDVKEGRKTNRKLFLEASKPGGGNLGSATRVFSVLGYLSQIYNQSEHCDDALKAELARAFVQLPPASLEQMAAALTPKQKTLVERIVADGQQLPPL